MAWILYWEPTKRPGLKHIHRYYDYTKRETVIPEKNVNKKTLLEVMPTT